MVITADANGITDGAAFQMLERVECILPIVLVAWSENFKFNEKLSGGIKDYVLVGFEEYGWDADLNETGTHIWGKNSDKFPRYYNGDWVRFDEWVRNNPPLLSFKRELLKRDASETILPIEYPSKNKAEFIDNKERFDGRPVKILNYWGRSHELRLKLHADIWLYAYVYGGTVCDNIYYFNDFMHNEGDDKKYVTLNIPHYGRMNMDSIFRINSVSKVTISMPGAGNKCFRDVEASLNSVMAIQKSSLAYTFKWDETNSIQFDLISPLHEITKQLNNPNLYEIYRNGVENCRKYYIDDYVKYLGKTINSAIK